MSRGEAPTFDRDLYGSAKEALTAAQHGKCAFCEAKILHVSFGDVEHFRPKAAWRQSADMPLQRPGYYWLAYEWTNLLLACELCNRRGKGNLFPLTDPASRAAGPDHDLAAEQPLFVDPATDDPAEHLGFRQEVVFARTSRGQATLDALELNRSPLLDHRRDRLRLLRSLREAQALVPELDGAGLLLARAVRDDAEHAAMVRALLRS